MAKRDIRAAAAEALEIPAEIALRTVKIVLVGDRMLKVINHRGILIYQAERIRFRTAEGAVELQGSDLSLAELTPEYLRIEGHIRGLQMLDSPALPAGPAEKQA